MWKSRFDPLVKIPCHTLIWAIMLGLPLKLWNPVVVAEIENIIGKFYFWDENSFGQLDNCLAWVLVEVDLGNSLLAEIDV